MTLRQLLSAALLTALFAAPALVRAQEISAAEEQRLEALARENAEIYRPKSTVTVSFRMLSSGANVHFGNLGIVPSIAIPASASAGNVSRVYNNGTVSADGPRAGELDSNGVQTSTPGGRYQINATSDITDANGNVIGTQTTLVSDNISYTPGLSRSWTYYSPNQVTADGSAIGMSLYSATSDGHSLDKKEGASGGLEVQFSRILGRISKRIEWGFSTGVALNNINIKTSSDVSATLHTVTDYYSLNGLAAPAATPDTPYTGPSYVDATAADGTTITNGYESTTPISQTPGSQTTSDVVGGATVHGLYQIKGAYFMVKFGPSLRAQLTEHLGLNASVGVAGAYSGTRYSVTETIDVPDVGGTISTPTGDESVATKFVSGYYADLNVEWAANDITGIFAGVTAQKLGKYDQTLDGRTARIDFGNTVGIRGGISVRF